MNATITGQFKQVPHSQEAEQSVLGGMLIDNRTIADVCELLTADDFFREDHQLIFTAIQQAGRDRRGVDFVVLSNWLKDREQLAAAGGLAYLTGLVMDTPSAANVVTYAGIVREKASLRALIAAGGALSEMGFRSDGQSIDDLLDQAERQVLAIRARSVETGGPAALASIVEAAELAIEKRRGQTGVAGLSTGFADLDEKTTGMHPGDLVVLGGRPSMGKTTFALNVAEHCAYKLRQPAAVFSMEMPAQQLCERLFASQGAIPLDNIRKGRLDDIDFDRITDLGREFRQTPLFIDETPALSPGQIRARARRLKARHGLSLIVVDYLQFMQVTGNKENRTNEIAEISRSLKAIAKELKVPVIALSQLNRSLEQRDNRRPRMSDLRESGGIEQDADLILFLYRDEVYDKDSAYAGTAEVIIGKQRNGPLGTVRLTYQGEICRFSNLPYEWEPAAPPESDQSVPPRSGFGRRKPGGMSHAAHAAPND